VECEHEGPDSHIDRSRCGEGAGEKRQLSQRAHFDLLCDDLGKDTVDVTAAATAALTAQSTTGPGGLPIPVGISRAWFENKAVFCDQPIQVLSDNSPEDAPAGTRMKKVLQTRAS